jgi:hypothetical protein
MQAGARNLRTVERFLLAPPLAADFASAPVSICDISARGARFLHEKQLETGKKGVLKLPMEGRSPALALEAVVVWSQREGGVRGKYVSGVRTYGSPDVVQSLIAQLLRSKRSHRIEELRSSDRFFVMPSLEATFGGELVSIENLSARGARIETLIEPKSGQSEELSFHVPGSDLDVKVTAGIAWSILKAISNSDVKSYRAGVQISMKPELMRLAIALLSDAGRATLDTQSLVLKLKIMRARARQFASSHKSIEASGVPAEQYLLIQGVREELRLNPEEAMHWYRRARLVIADPTTRADAPVIADYPDALAVWEYLDRSVDQSLIGRAFNLAR